MYSTVLHTSEILAEWYSKTEYTCQHTYTYKTEFYIFMLVKKCTILITMQLLVWTKRTQWHHSDNFFLIDFQICLLKSHRLKHALTSHDLIWLHPEKSCQTSYIGLEGCIVAHTCKMKRISAVFPELKPFDFSHNFSLRGHDLWLPQTKDIKILQYMSYITWT